jgi:catechol 2,3-dioxygenase-like lactoylglutathione lyase family enzyme
MPIEIIELHHPGFRVDDEARKLDETVDFYTKTLGLEKDTSRPTIPGIPGAWINIGEVGQLHLFGGNRPSPVAKGPGQDPTRPHVAFAVKDILAAKKELDRMGVKYWQIEGLTAPDALQIFMDDPCGNMVELHQIDKCNCRRDNRKARN